MTHDHAHPSAGHPPAGGTPGKPGRSLLQMSAGQRLLLVALPLAGLWALVAVVLSR